MTKQTYQKLKKEIKQELLQEFIFPMLQNSKDPEGEYNPKFVKRVLKAAKQKPTHVFVDADTFLKELRRR